MYRYLRSSVSLPPLQLKHIDARLSFFQDHVDGAETLTMAARRKVSSIALDAKALEIFDVSFPDSGSPAQYTVDAPHNKLDITLPKPLAAGEAIRVSVRCRSVPTDTILDGIYRDVTPPGAPQQYMSQCQQWGFERILPVIDDCTAKCTFRTTLEGDVRYTHMISNGDVDRSANPDGRPVAKPGDPSRQIITYVNNVPMAPYLFIACAGTWDELTDSVTYPNGKRVALSYLVPKGRLDGARLPMEILKRSILWQNRKLGFVYPYESYRTICMEKSNYGGMENVGNTTIITEAALIDGNIGDRRLVYAHGVIVHEYEHSHCGSGVTMASPFDMWLNEAYTVDIERQFLADTFNPVFMRLQEVDELRAPGEGPLAVEDTGKAPAIVREGFNDPDEVVDGLTYDKAPEVLNMLRQLVGPAAYAAATSLYFRRYAGGNADTDQFLACFAETVPDFPMDAFAKRWLFGAGYPKVTAGYAYDTAKRTLTLKLRQDARKPFVLPFSFAVVNSEGRDLVAQTFRFDKPAQTVVLKDIDRPAFLSLNRGAGFYGTCEDTSATDGQLVAQIFGDSDFFNRVEAMRRLTDRQRGLLMRLDSQGDRDLASWANGVWLDVYRRAAAAADVPDGVKAYLLSVDEEPFDRRLLPNVRENAAIRRDLLRTANRAVTLESARSVLFAKEPDALPAAIERRALKNAFLQLLSVRDTPEAFACMEEHLERSADITDRLNTLAAIWQSADPRRLGLLERERARQCGTLGGFLGYLKVVGTSPRPEVFDAVMRETTLPGFDWTHPGKTRALFVPLTLNNAQVWTPLGRKWMEETFVRLAPTGEYSALRLMGPCFGYKAFAPDLRDSVREMLCRVRARLDSAQCPWVKARLDEALEGK
jgi:aminopeptidase N